MATVELVIENFAQTVRADGIARRSAGNAQSSTTAAGPT